MGMLQYLIIGRMSSKSGGILRLNFCPTLWFLIMSEVNFKKHRVFRETDSVIFYDISVENSNASDLVVHTGPAISPPNDVIGAKQFYIHYHQVDHNRVLSGMRTFELVNPEWKYPYHIVNLNRSSGALVVPIGT